MAAQSTLHSSCKKRKDVLPKTVQFIVGVITSNDATPSQKDGALHMVNIKQNFITVLLVLTCIYCFECFIAWRLG